MEIFKYVNSKETESLAKTTVYKSAWIKAWGLGNKEGGSLRGGGLITQCTQCLPVNEHLAPWLKRLTKNPTILQQLPS